MHGLCFEGRWGWTHVLFVIWLSLLAAAPTKAFGYFLGDTKAVLNGCKDHWTLQDRAAMPLLFQMTLCVDIRVVVPGAWVAFSYSSVHAPRPELGLEGDEDALYAWLLRVRHRFPIRLSPKHWHRVCLRRDVQHNSFSLEVDGKMVAQRTVIAHAIPPAGSMWLGCRPRDQPPGDTLGEVELYLFRMWGDLGNHGLCEDGSVIGWNTYYWGVTSPRARQRDPNLLCVIDSGRIVQSNGLRDELAETQRYYRFTNNRLDTISRHSPALHYCSCVRHTLGQSDVNQHPKDSNHNSGSSLVNCDISQLCSNDSAYFWMTINVTAKSVSKTEQDVHNLVSNAFSCATNRSDTAQRVTDFIDFCQGDKFIQTVQVNCSAKSNIRKTTCDVLLQLSRAVSACELQRAGDSALQQAADTQIEVRITGEVERVGRGICGDVEPSSGRFVRCTSTSSLDDICQANTNPKLTCSFLEPNSYQALQPDKEFGCSEYHSEAPSFCDCTAFCNSSRQFFAIRINIHSVSVNVNLLKTWLAGLARMCLSMSASECPDILERYQHAHLECHGTEQRLYSCMVILEMSGPVNGCFLKKLLKQIIDRNNYITNEKPLTRMVVCGPPGLAIRTLLGSNLTWVESDLLMSDVCQPDPTLLKCEGKESLAVLLSNSCPLETMQSTTMPSTPNTIVTSQQTNASQGTADPNIIISLTTNNRTQSSTEQPVLRTTLQNMTFSTAAQNTTLPDNTTPTDQTKLQNTTTADQGTTEFIPLSSVNSTLQFTTAAPIVSTLYTATLSPNQTTEFKPTTVDTVTPSPNHITDYNETAVSLSTNHTTEYNVTSFTPYINHTTKYNATTVTSTINHTTDYNATTVTIYTNPTTENNVTRVTPFNNHTTEYNVSTIGSDRKDNSTFTTKNTTFSTFTASPNHTVVINVTAASNNHTTVSNNYTTQYNLTTADANWDLHNSTFTTNNATINTFTASPNYTTETNVTTVSNNYTKNITTMTESQNKTETDNVTTASINETQLTTTAPTAQQLNVTLNGDITSREYSTVDNLTSVVDNITKPTADPLNNQTKNPTTSRVRPYTTSTNKNDTFTTVANAVNTIINHNQTAVTRFNQSTTVRSPTNDFNLTTKEEVHLKTTKSTTPTKHGTHLSWKNTTTAKVSLTSSTTTFQINTLPIKTTTLPGMYRLDNRILLENLAV
ncbi:hypothetical protein JOQ06_018345 [Pogonophryne albipinna]|uniref:Uncharacterized protein n=1 Tax=Pogonophryne albipinna TaxID=1090488 RepID=A0AAD6F8I4_9TELE|nr:hypothetical protein JOQ06_018345 [Pogonophryne albipinna]